MDLKASVYKWAIIGTVAFDATIAAFVAFMVAQTGNSSWAWLLLLWLITSPSQTAKLATTRLGIK